MTPKSAPENIQVIVCDAKLAAISEVNLSLALGSSVQDALTQARTHTGFATLIDEAVAVGVFGKRCDDHTVLHDGDRVELYRGLVVDPKIARRRRAAHRQKVRQTKNKVPINDRTT